MHHEGLPLFRRSMPIVEERESGVSLGVLGFFMVFPFYLF